MTQGSLVVVFLMINLTCAEALDDMYICFILDGILIIYGVVLTVLYCRLKIKPVNTDPGVSPEKQKQASEGGIYAGLGPRHVDTYETIKVDKRPIV
ncbi:Fc receptor, IgE, high affinity I, gamma polypeptide like isoform 2-T2 [Polymixia lowei]